MQRRGIAEILIDVDARADQGSHQFGVALRRRLEQGRGRGFLGRHQLEVNVLVRQLPGQRLAALVAVRHGHAAEGRIDQHEGVSVRRRVQ